MNQNKLGADIAGQIAEAGYDSEIMPGKKVNATALTYHWWGQIA